MITLNNFEIINDGTAIAIDVETIVGETILSINLWDKDGFDDYNKAYSISHLLSGVAHEVLIVTAVELGITKFSDIWFCAVKSSEENPDPCETCSNPALGITYNLRPYYACLVEALTSQEIYDCYSCDIPTINNKPITISLTIDAIKKAIELGYYFQAIEFLTKLKKYCNVLGCKACDDIANIGCKTCSEFKQI